jgi:DNA-binding PadR family transcriptional regulator
MGAMSGYDIRALIGRSIGYFWSESYGQIYPGLKRLAAAGLVEKKTERQRGRPDRHVYSLTVEGRIRLKEWLKLPATSEPPRNELLLKLFFGAQVPHSVSREHVTEFVEQHKKALKTYAAIAKELLKDGDNAEAPFWLMTLSLGKHASDASVKWARETLKKLDELENHKGGRR